MGKEEFNLISASAVLICTSAGGTDDVSCFCLQELKEELIETNNYSMVNRLFEEDNTMHGNNTEIITFIDNIFVKILLR